jgi:hypothetical protein
LISVLGIALASCATHPSASPALPEAKPELAKAVTESVAVSAKLVQVNRGKRLVTFELPDGRRVSARVHARAGSLDALQPGDLVRVTYYESIAYDVRAPGTPPPAEASAATIADASGAVDARSVTITSRITAVNASAGTLTLQAPDADPLTVRVKHPDALLSVHVGDLADVTLSEAVAVTIEKTP